MNSLKLVIEVIDHFAIFILVKLVKYGEKCVRGRQSKLNSSDLPDPKLIYNRSVFDRD